SDLTCADDATLSDFIVSFCNDTATTHIYTLSLHALFRSPSAPTAPAAPGPASSHRPRPSRAARRPRCRRRGSTSPARSCPTGPRSEEHTSELQSRENLVCRLLLEKKKIKLILFYWEGHLN